MPPAQTPHYVLDAAAILEGLNLEPAACVTAAAVMAEISEGGATGRRAGYLEAAGLRVLAPEPAWCQTVDRAAADHRVAGRLSEADRDVLALAWGRKLPLVTDDYTLQDLARRLEVAWVPAAKPGIRDGRTWRARCTGCGRHWPMKATAEPCRVCGSEVRARPKR